VPARPWLEPGVVLTLKTEIVGAGEEELLTAIAWVENLGTNAVTYQFGCGYGVRLTIENSDGSRLIMQDPALRPDCPPLFHELSPGAMVRESLDLSWAWDENGDRYPLGPGRYTIRAEFVYYLGDSEDRHPVTGAVDAELH